MRAYNSLSFQKEHSYSRERILYSKREIVFFTTGNKFGIVEDNIIVTGMHSLHQM